MLAIIKQVAKDALRQKTLFPKRRSPKWPAVRHKHLKANPACAACGETDHVEVHHIEAYHLHEALELVPGNLLTLCDDLPRRCHLNVGHRLPGAKKGNWKVNNPDVVKDASEALRVLPAASA